MIKVGCAGTGRAVLFCSVLGLNRLLGSFWDAFLTNAAIGLLALKSNDAAHFAEAAGVRSAALHNSRGLAMQWNHVLSYAQSEATP